MLTHQQQQTHLFIVVVLLLIPLTCVSYQSLGFEKKMLHSLFKNHDDSCVCSTLLKERLTK